MLFNKGDKFPPRGTPNVILNSLDVLQNKLTNYHPSVDYEWNQYKRGSPIPDLSKIRLQ